MRKTTWRQPPNLPPFLGKRTHLTHPPHSGFSKGNGGFDNQNRRSTGIALYAPSIQRFIVAKNQ